MDSKLLSAIRENNVEKVNKILLNLNLNITEYRKNTIDHILRWAAENGRLDVVKFLVENGADIHARNDQALRWAAEKGRLDVVKFLVENGANVHADNDLALRWAAANGHLDVVQLLIKNRANISSRNDEALRWAAGFGHLDVVKLLVDNGANPEVENNEAIRNAAENRYIDIVAYLFQDPRVRDAGLPFPDPASKDPLARILGEILMTSMYTTHEIMQTPFKKNPRLAEHHLMSHILKYHPIVRGRERK